MPRFEFVVTEEYERVFEVHADSIDEAREIFNANKAKQIAFDRTHSNEDHYVAEFDDNGELVDEHY